MDAVSTDREGLVTVAGSELRLPWGIRRRHRVDDRCYVVLQPFKRGVADPDLELSNGLRNVLAVDADGSLEWVVEPVGEAGPDGNYHSSVVQCDDEELVTGTYNGRRHRIDGATGEMLESWSGSEYPIGGRMVEFAGSVSTAITFDDGITVVRTSSGGTNLWGFDEDGRELWRRLDDRFSWVLEDRGGECWVWDEPNFGRKISYRVDRETGYVVEAHANVPDTQAVVDFGAIDGPYLHPWLSSVFLLDEDGEKRWGVSFEERVDDATLCEDGSVRVETEDGEVHRVSAEGELL